MPSLIMYTSFSELNKLISGMEYSSVEQEEAILSGRRLTILLTDPTILFSMQICVNYLDNVFAARVGGCKCVLSTFQTYT